MTFSEDSGSIHAWQSAHRKGADAWQQRWEQTLTKVRCMAEPTEGAIVGASVDELKMPMDGGLKGPLAGVPWMLKDLFDVIGQETRASSTFLAQVRPGPLKNSAVVSALSRAGAVLLGKTHLNEFAYGLDGVNPHFGTVSNPRLPGRLAGGSSSGSAWAVASGLVPFAVGTDTGGSIRVPAAFCGLYGFRLTPEHPWSNEGCFPLARSFDTAGFFTRSAADLSILLSLLDETVNETSLPMGLDLTRVYSVDANLSTAMKERIKGWTQSASADEMASWRADTADLVASFNILQSSEALELHRDWLHTRKADYDPATWQRIARAEEWTTDQRAAAGNTAQRWKTTLARWIEDHGFLVLPTAPSMAPRMKDGMPSALREGILAMTAPASLAGHPVLSIPVGSAPDSLTAVQVVLPKDLGAAIPLAKRILKDTTD